MSSEFVAVYVTVPNLETGTLCTHGRWPNRDFATGKSIGRSLVSEKLAACVNVIPGLTSIYSWEGSVEEDSELLLMIKTRSKLIDTLTSKVKEMHPYDVCEVISVPITGGNSQYLDWIRSSTNA